MAILFCYAQIIKRSEGRSAVAAAAYRCGMEFEDERTGQTHDYTRKQGVLAQGILAPEDAPDWVYDPQQLWNRVEAREDRWDSQLSRELVIAIPHEVEGEHREYLVKNCLRPAVRDGAIAHYMIHEPSREGDERNYHAHVMLTMRRLTPDGESFGNKAREWNDKQALYEWKKTIERESNRMLERLGYDERVSVELEEGHRPTRHMGHRATNLERKGIKTQRGEENREIQAENARRKQQKEREQAELAREIERLEAEERQRQAEEARKSAEIEAKRQEEARQQAEEEQARKEAQEAEQAQARAQRLEERRKTAQRQTEAARDQPPSRAGLPSRPAQRPPAPMEEIRGGLPSRPAATTAEREAQRQRQREQAELAREIERLEAEKRQRQAEEEAEATRAFAEMMREIREEEQARKASRAGLPSRPAQRPPPAPMEATRGGLPSRPASPDAEREAQRQREAAEEWNKIRVPSRIERPASIEATQAPTAELWKADRLHRARQEPEAGQPPPTPSPTNENRPQPPPQAAPRQAEANPRSQTARAFERAQQPERTPQPEPPRRRTEQRESFNEAARPFEEAEKAQETRRQGDGGDDSRTQTHAPEIVNKRRPRAQTAEEMRARQKERGGRERTREPDRD